MDNAILYWLLSQAISMRIRHPPNTIEIFWPVMYVEMNPVYVKLCTMDLSQWIWYGMVYIYIYTIPYHIYIYVLFVIHKTCILLCGFVVLWGYSSLHAEDASRTLMDLSNSNLEFFTYDLHRQQNKRQVE